jgi:integrase
MSGMRRGNGESWISGSPNARGYYEAFVTIGTKPSGKPDRRHIQRKTLRAVRQAVRGLERKRDSGAVDKPGRMPTIEQMLTRHVQEILPQRGRAPRTIDDYWSKCRNDIFPALGGQRINHLRPEQVEDFYAAMLAEGHAAGHVRKVHAILSSALEEQAKRGHIVRNPCRLVEPPSLAQPAQVALTRGQARAVLAVVAERRNATRWKIGLACGLRQGEALGLRWEFVDLGTGRMRVWYQLQRLTWRHGCTDIVACTQNRHRRPCPLRCPKAARTSGRRHLCIAADDPRVCPPDCAGHAARCPERRGGGLVFREVKERRRKTVQLPPELVTALKEHRDAQYLEKLDAGSEWQEHGLVFAQVDGRPVDPRGDWEEWSDILKAAGVPHHGVHAMRHSAATIALGEGIALAVVQEMLGHSDIRITRGYTHVGHPLAEDAAERMGRALFGETH